MIEQIRYLVLYVGVVLCLMKVLDITYLFQIKEYRFDRFFVFLDLKHRVLLQVIRPLGHLLKAKVQLL